MPSQAQKDLKACLIGKKTAAEKAPCYQAFAVATGATVEGGKVFEAPNGEAVFVTTGGKVFNGGKVF